MYSPVPEGEGPVAPTYSFGVKLGQPKTETGSRPEENQVSRTSVSWVIVSEPQWEQATGSPVVPGLGSVILPHVAQCQAGIRWPHQSWRLMHQS